MSTRQRQILNLFWLGFLLYTLGYTLSIGPNPYYMICDLLRLSGIVLFVLSACFLLSYRLENWYLSSMFVLYMIWQFIVVFRGIEPNVDAIKNTLFNPLNGVFLYLTPLVVLLPKKLEALNFVFRVIFVLGLLYLACSTVTLSTILIPGDVQGRAYVEVFNKLLALPCGFLLMTYNYQGKGKKILALAVILFSIILASLAARRGLIFMSGSILILAFLIFLYVNKRQSALVVCSIFAGFSILVLGLGAFGNSNLEFVKRIKERLEEDTRSEVELYFYADMEPRDWLIGRGMNGLVAAPSGIDESGDNFGYRDGIETDYLNIILKGGGIRLGLLLLIAIPAMFKGLMFSNNSLSKAAGFWILIWLISLYPSTVTTFSMQYILVWISIGICYSRRYRNLSEETLRAYFKGTLIQTVDKSTEIKGPTKKFHR